jgi:hypothetical protein
VGIALPLYATTINWGGVCTAVAVSGACGLLLGPVLGGLAWGAAQRARLLALGVGALGTGLGALCAAEITLMVLGHSSPDLPVRLLVLAFGATASLPPGLGYLAVRSRGRSGLPVLLASALWLVVPVALAFVGGEMI